MSDERPLFWTLALDVTEFADVKMERGRLLITFGPVVKKIAKQAVYLQRALNEGLNGAVCYDAMRRRSPEQRKAAEYQIGMLVMACPCCHLLWLIGDDEPRCSHGREATINSIDAGSGAVGVSAGREHWFCTQLKTEAEGVG